MTNFFLKKYKIKWFIGTVCSLPTVIHLIIPRHGKAFFRYGALSTRIHQLAAMQSFNIFVVVDSQNNVSGECYGMLFRIWLKFAINYNINNLQILVKTMAKWYICNCWWIWGGGISTPLDARYILQILQSLPDYGIQSNEWAWVMFHKLIAQDFHLNCPLICGWYIWFVTYNKTGNNHILCLDS